MAVKIRWSPTAIIHFEEIYNYISRDSEKYASIFVKKVMAIVKSIPDFPKAGRVVPEYDDENLREKMLGNYRIVYRIKKDAFEIVTISSGSRLLKDILR
jgi:plasmid stabilization system protein ParE